MYRPTRSILLIVLGIAIGIAISVAEIGFAEYDVNNTETSATELPLDELRSFVEILNRVKQGYVEEVSDKDLIENSIRGMLDGLDPHSAYLSPQAFKELSISTTGEFGGLGIQVTMDNGFVRVVAPIDDTPAKRAGVEAGDLIIRINDEPVKGMTLMEAVKVMRGKPGSEITLTILREGETAPFEITIERAVIEVKSVKSRMLDDGYGYIRISHFANHTGDNLRQQIKDLKEQAGGSLKGIVLDLRNNPGGVLHAAVAVADTFLEDGQVVSMRGRAPNTDQVFKAEPGDLLDGQPIVVLVNEGSASASEIVAGALKDNGRAIIMGRRTFGKGSVQTILPLKSGAAIKLTTARYYTPSGDSIQARGITPDVVIEHVVVQSAKKDRISPLSEADLAGVLSNDTIDGDGDGDDSSGAVTPKHLAEKDYALYEALNLL
ncbi:MAG: S41 family peptidase, partial [Luteimonas sp.]|nr:S41 family peptidase [Luteimonas sp.]